MIQGRIHKIVDLCKHDIITFDGVDGIDFVDLFPQSINDKKLLDEEALINGIILQKTDRGNFYYFENRFKQNLAPSI